MKLYTVSCVNNNICDCMKEYLLRLVLISLVITMYFIDTGEVKPVVRGSTDSIVILPLNEGTQFTLFSSSVDNVGNRQPLTQSMQDSVYLEFPIVGIQCPDDCSGNGNCTLFGDCVCENGHYGDNCSQSTLICNKCMYIHL